LSLLPLVGLSLTIEQSNLNRSYLNICNHQLKLRSLILSLFSLASNLDCRYAVVTKSKSKNLISERYMSKWSILSFENSIRTCSKISARFRVRKFSHQARFSNNFHALSCALWRKRERIRTNASENCKPVPDAYFKTSRLEKIRKHLAWRRFSIGRLSVRFRWAAPRKNPVTNDVLKLLEFRVPPSERLEYLTNSKKPQFSLGLRGEGSSWTSGERADARG
jgi:hypothetical protein